MTDAMHVGNYLCSRCRWSVCSMPSIRYLTIPFRSMTFIRSVNMYNLNYIITRHAPTRGRESF